MEANKKLVNCKHENKKNQVSSKHESTRKPEMCQTKWKCINVTWKHKMKLCFFLSRDCKGLCIKEITNENKWMKWKLTFLFLQNP